MTKHQEAAAAGRRAAISALELLPFYRPDYCQACYSQGVAFEMMMFYLQSMTDREAADYLLSLTDKLLKAKRGEAGTSPSDPDRERLH